MKLTGNALSMLLKRYRAVLGKCRTLNWLAGMVLAGGIVLGGASGAMATVYTPETLNGPLAEPKRLESGDTIGAGIYTLGQGANFAPTEVTIGEQTRANYVGVIVGNGVSLDIVNGTTFTGSSFVQNKDLKPNAAGIFLVQTGGTITIKPGVTFSNNTFVAHGAITSTKTSDSGIATININGSASGPQIVFSGNTSGGAGAAISNFSKAQMTVGNVLFKDNTVNNDINGAGGGAVFMGAVSTNLINGATFDGNKVTSEEGAWGGAIATRGTDDGAGGKVRLADGTMTIGNSTFTGNYAAQRGGAIYTAFYKSFDTTADPEDVPQVSSADITTSLIYNSTFNQNKSAMGGAIYNDGSADSTSTKGKLTVVNSSFTNNQATGSQGQGGAIWNSGELTLINDTFSGNTASQGGAIYNSGTLTLSGTNTFSNNSAGGKPNDIYNAENATLNITGISGQSGTDANETHIDSGIVNLGTITISKGTATETVGAAGLTGSGLTVSGLLAGTASKVIVGAATNLDFGSKPVTLLSSQLSAADNSSAVTSGIWLAPASGSDEAGTLIVDNLTLGDSANAFNGGTKGVISVASSLTSGNTDGITFTGGKLSLGNQGSGASSSINGNLSLTTAGTSLAVKQGSWTMNNNAALSIGTDTTLTIGDGTNTAELNLTADGETPAGSLSNSGTVTVNNKGELSLAGIGALLGTAAAKGTVVVEAGGVLDFGGVESTLLGSQLVASGTTAEAGKIWLKAKSGTTAAGQLMVDNLVLGDADTAFTGGTTGVIGVGSSLKDGNGAGITWNSGTLRLSTDSKAPSTAIEPATVTGSITTSGTGNVVVGGGYWTLGANTNVLDIVTGTTLTIGGQGMSATLDVTGGKNGSSTENGALKSAAAGAFASGAVSTGIGVLSGGTLIANSTQLFKGSDSSTGLVSGLNAIYVAANGLIHIKGDYGNDGVSLTQMAKNKELLLATGSAGVIEYDKVNTTGITSWTDGSANPSETSVGSASDTGIVLSNNTVVAAAGTVDNNDLGAKVNGGYVTGSLNLTNETGSYTSASVTLENATDNSGTTLTLLGNGEGKQLIQVAGADPTSSKPLTVSLSQAGSTLNLGTTQTLKAANTGTDVEAMGGTLTGNVTFGNASAALNAAGPNDVTYTIEGTVGDSSNTSNGVVSANTTNLVVTQGILGVKTVNTNNGNITVDAGGIKTAALKADGGEITSVTGAITTTTADVSNGAIVSAAVATTTNDAITASDETSVSNGGIILSKGGSISLKEVTLNGGSIGIGDFGTPFSLKARAAREISSGLVNLTEAADGNITSSGTVTANGTGNYIKTTNGAITLSDAVTVNDGGQLDISATGGNITFEDATDINDTGILNITANASEGASPAGGNVIAKGALNATSIVADGNITAEDASSNAQAITADTVSAANGTITAGELNVGSAGGENSLTAKKLSVTKLTMDNGGDFTLNANGGTASTISETMQLTGVEAEINESLSTSQGATIDGGSFTAGDNTTITFGAASTIKGGAEASYNNLKVSAGGLTVGDANDNKSTQLIVTGLLDSVGGLNLGGNANAPALAAINAVGDSSSGTAPTGAGTLNGNITIGANSALALGSSEIADANKADATNGGLYVGAPIDLNNKTITVGNYTPSADGSTDSAAELKVGANSSTVVNVAGREATDGPIINGAVFTNDGAKLTIAGATVGQTFKLAESVGSSETDGTGWNNDNLTSDNPLIQFSGSADELTASLNSASNFLPEADADTAAMLNSVADKLGPSGKNSSYRGIAFLSSALAMLNSSGAPTGGASAAAASVANALPTKAPRGAGDPAIQSKALGGDSPNARLVTKTIEGAERMIVVGAVPQMTRMASQAAAEAVTQRTSMAIPSGVKTQQATDKVALWVMPLYQSANGAGMDAGKLDADFNGAIGGIALGADYTFANAIRAGISFNIGGGYATGGGDFADTTNNMNFWGLGAYAGWAQDNIGLSADVSFTSAYNKLSQDLPSEMSGWKDLKADVRSWALATGVKAEYKFETSALDIIPHLGVRYMYLNAEDYKLKSDGTVFKGDAMRQNIWTFPVGVNFSRSFQTASGWNVKPMADLMIVPALGDINANPTGRFTGTDYKVSDQNTQIMDHVTYQGQLGIEFGSDNLNFGLSGSAQFGEKTSGYGVLGSFRYEF